MIEKNAGNDGEKAFNQTLKRMLETPPKPHVKDSETESHQKKKPGGNPAKNNRPED
ncbi:hypothetical protein [Mesorhizobium sp. Root157]|uniref:hypothetical protein n=1 Tax=Mesorhizobium sp. Root157 TaxID=1736477 RepID=UPI000ABE2324|nr:hypothetical protein [Mesorhizobium sp. Root157]